MSSEDVVVTLEDRIRVIRLNRPRSKNAFNSTVYTTITRTLNEDATNDNIVMTILTGTGEYYSSGADFKSSLQQGGDSETKINEVRSMIKAFFSYPKLLIALVNGPAIGISVTTAALCDIVYASENATFETPFIKIGLCAEGCSSYTFPQIFGRSKASELLLLGKKLTAQDALRSGFVAEVIPHGKFDNFFDELKKLGRTLSVSSVKINKKLILDNYKNVLCECNDRELKQLAECFESEEFGEAIMRFMTRKSKL